MAEMESHNTLNAPQHTLNTPQHTLNTPQHTFGTPPHSPQGSLLKSGAGAQWLSEVSPAPEQAAVIPRTMSWGLQPELPTVAHWV